MGKKLFHFQAKLPNYLINKTIKLDRLQGKVPDDILAFIKSDVTDFTTTVCGKKDDLEGKLYFLVLNSIKEYFIFEPPFQASASKVKFVNLKRWGIEMATTSPTKLTQCRDKSHGNHAFLLPFFWMMFNC